MIRRHWGAILGAILASAVLTAMWFVRTPVGSEYVPFVILCGMLGFLGAGVGHVGDLARIPPALDPRRLAQDALDHAAKAADLGLPTGEWTDLAAFWTSWADQQDTATAPEKPAQRPTPPKGRAGVWSPIPLLSVDRVDTTGHADGGPTDTPTAWSLPQISATTPPSDIVVIGDNMITIPHTGNVARYDLLVWHDGHPAPRLIPGVPKRTAGYDELNLPGKPARTLARVVMPPRSATVQQAQITDLRSDRCVHTAEMWGAPAIRHEVPCDCATNYAD